MAQRNDRGEVRGAGGIVLRHHGDTTQLVMVHRPAFGDWTLPKGKVKKHETDAIAALREVREETGLLCELGAEAGAVHYRDRKDRRKVVRFWLMTPLAGAFAANDEVDRCEWLDLVDGAERATRSGERQFLAEVTAKLVARSDALSLVIVHEQP